MPAKKKDPSTRARQNKASTAATLEQREPPTIGDYSDRTVVQLREAIAELNLGRPPEQQIPKAGKKAELVERLTEAMAAGADKVPPMPMIAEPGWHTEVVRWWTDVWTSPMSPEWDDSDVHNVAMCAVLLNDFWTAPSAAARSKAAGEFRLQRQALGLSPYDRRRLEWTFETADEAKARGAKRRGGQGPADQGAPQPDPTSDPRLVLVQ